MTTGYTPPERPNAMWRRAQQQLVVSRDLADAEQVEQAAAGYRSALRLFRAAGDEEKVAHCIFELGDLTIEQNQPEQALELFREALRMSLATGNRELEARAHEDVGRSQFWLGDYAAALTEYERAAELYGEQNDRDGLAAAVYGAGHCLMGMAQYREAEEALQAALTLCRLSGERDKQADMLAGLTLCALERDRLKDAIAYMAEANAINQELGRSQFAMSQAALKELRAIQQSKRELMGRR